jgi:transposase
VPGAKPRYSKEFKSEAVQLIRSSGRSIPQLANELGVSDGSLRNWLKQADIDEGVRDGLTTHERQELNRLRREVKILQQEREILKKAELPSLPRRMGSGELLQVHRCAEGYLSHLGFM